MHMARRETKQSSMVAYTNRARGVMRHLSVPVPVKIPDDYFYKSSFPGAPKVNSSSQSSSVGCVFKKSNKLPPLLEKKTRSLDQFDFVETAGKEEFQFFSDSELPDQVEESGANSVSVGLTADEVYLSRMERLGKVSDSTERACSPAFDIKPFPDFNVEDYCPYYTNSRIRAAIKNRKLEKRPAKPRKIKSNVNKNQQPPKPWKPKYRSKSKGKDYDRSKHPIRKHFIYSDVVDKELKSPRIPGSLLKPIYKRDQENGDVSLPKAPIEVHMEELVLSQPPSPSEEESGIKNEALKEYLEKAARKREKKKKLRERKRVRFLLPDESLNSAATRRSRGSIRSPPPSPSCITTPDNGLLVTTSPILLGQTLLSEVALKLESLENKDEDLKEEPVSNTSEACAAAQSEADQEPSKLSLPPVISDIPNSNQQQSLLPEISSHNHFFSEQPSLRIPCIMVTDTTD